MRIFWLGTVLTSIMSAKLRYWGARPPKASTLVGYLVGASAIRSDDLLTDVPSKYYALLAIDMV